MTSFLWLPNFFEICFSNVFHSCGFELFSLVWFLSLSCQFIFWETTIRIEYIQSFFGSLKVLYSVEWKCGRVSSLTANNRAFYLSFEIFQLRPFYKFDFLEDCRLSCCRTKVFNNPLKWRIHGKTRLKTPSFLFF